MKMPGEALEKGFNMDSGSTGPWCSSVQSQHSVIDVIGDLLLWGQVTPAHSVMMFIKRNAGCQM
jgi:hypothetical protein